MKAPNFSLSDQNGIIHKLSDYKGKWLLLYFYPEDDTPGCTKEACNFRDTSLEYKKLGVEIVGVSMNSVKSHKKFEQKYDLNFTLLADPKGIVVQSYGAWGEKQMFGRKFMGILRNTYLINPNGEIVKTYERVNPSNHPGEILNDLESLLI